MLPQSASFSIQIRKSYLFDEIVELVPGRLLVHALVIDEMTEDSKEGEDVVAASIEDSNGKEDAVVASTEDSDPDDGTVASSVEASNKDEDNVVAPVLEILETVR